MGFSVPVDNSKNKNVKIKAFENSYLNRQAHSVILLIIFIGIRFYY